jgi:hypothetical protein
MSIGAVDVGTKKLGRMDGDGFLFTLYVHNSPSHGEVSGGWAAMI